MKTAIATDDHGGTAVTHRAGDVHDGIQRCLDCGFEFPLDLQGTGFGSGDWVHTRTASGYELGRPSPTLAFQAQRCTA